MNNNKQPTPTQVALTKFRKYGVTLNELDGTRLPKLRWVIPNVLPLEGVAMIFGAPKLGKSVFVLNMVLEAAVGGFDTGNLNTLYIALETSLRREQQRMKAILGNTKPPFNVYLETGWRILNRGGMQDLDEYLYQQQTDIVVVDTWGAVRDGKRGNNQSLYQAERAEIEDLQDMAYKHSVLIWLVHHTNKAKQGGWQNWASGSNAVIGTCDTLMCYDGEENSNERVLYVKGRDVDEQEFSVHYNQNTMRTKISPATTKHSNSPIYNKIVNHMEECCTVQTPQDVASSIRENVSTVNAYMVNLMHEGVLLRDGYGKYVINFGGK